MIPRDKNSIFKCPKCTEKIQVPAVAQHKTAPAHHRKPYGFSFGEELNALICIRNDGLEKKIVSTVKQMGLNAEVVTNTQSALKKFEYHIYHLVIIDDAFDQDKGISGVIDRVNTMDMSLRRRICLVWVTNKFNTNDHMASLHLSVNAILHQDDITHIEPFLSRALLEHKHLYTVYNDSLKSAGKA